MSDFNVKILSMVLILSFLLMIVMCLLLCGCASTRVEVKNDTIFERFVEDSPEDIVEEDSPQEVGCKK